jgi:hypothetical protein
MKQCAEDGRGLGTYITKHVRDNYVTSQNHADSESSVLTSRVPARDIDEPIDLLAKMAAASLGPLARLTEKVDLTLDQIGEWVAKPENRRNIFNLVALLDAQAQLLISQQRVVAAAHLAHIAADQNAPPETVRRACKDLLTLKVIERAKPRGLRGGDDLAPLPLPQPKSSIEDILKSVL